MRTRVVALVVTLGAVATAAWAGRTNYFETTVNLVSRTAYGSLYDTRHSADFVQYIGCALYVVGGTTRVTCEARNAASETLNCTTADPEIVKVAQGLTDNGYIYYRCEDSDLVYLYVSRNSLWLP